MHSLITLFFILFFVFQSIIAVYFLIPPVFTIIHLIRKWFRFKPAGERFPYTTDKQFEFGIVVTAHEQTEFIQPLIDSLLKQTYGNFYVYVVADACDISQLRFSDHRISILRPEVPLNAKIKSIDFAIKQFQKEHDALIIFDSDNLIHPEFMQAMNDYFRKGFRAVQADFKPKNTDTVFARMDAIGDIFNFFLEREMRMELGLSSAIWGSGVAIDLKLYKEVVYHHLLGGFDKKLQAHLLERLPLIAFAKEAVLYDEKIANGAALERQRTRWINAQFKYLKLGLSLLKRAIAKGSFNQFYCAFVTIRPPMFVVVALALAFMIIDFFIAPAAGYWWMVIFSLFVLSFIGIVAIKAEDKRMLKTIFFMPLFMMRQTLALLKISKANKSFLKTRHSKVVFIDEVLQNRSA